MDFESCQDDYGFQEIVLSHRDGSIGGGNPEDVMSRLNLEIEFGSERLLNLEMLVMEVANRASDIEPLMLDPGSLSAESLEKAFEFDLLYGIVNSEVGELEKLVDCIQIDIGNVEKKVNEEESEGRLKGKLQAATESLRQMQELITTVRRESANFDIIDPSHHNAGTNEGGTYENGHVSSHTTIQADGQRNVLQMLEQSIANELDLENKLSDSGVLVEELKMKLHHVEHGSYFLEESVEAISERMFAAENASELLFVTSKELVDRINTMQYHLNASDYRESDLKSKLEQCLVQLNALNGSPEMLQDDGEKNASQDVMQSQRLSTPEFFTLQHKIQKLEQWLRESCSQLQFVTVSTEGNEKEHTMSQSETSTLRNIINDIKDAISKAEIRTQNAEARCAELTNTNGELNHLKTRGSDKAGLLEMDLMETEAQLEHTRASVEAISAHQSMLVSSISDKQHVIEDLKEKYLKAETRAESAESKCTLLTDSNFELSEEISFLRGRIDGLENSLHKANQLKLSTAKVISIKTKTITDLVAKLALERERLHLQIVTLTKKNTMLTQKCKENVNEGTLLRKKNTVNEGELRPTIVTEEVLLASSPMQTKVKTTAPADILVGEKEAGITAALDDESGTLEIVHSIEPTLLNWKYIFAAFLIFLAAALVHLLLTQS